jgi:hypothetical protein
MSPSPPSVFAFACWTRKRARPLRPYEPSYSSTDGTSVARGRRRRERAANEAPLEATRQGLRLAEEATEQVIRQAEQVIEEADLQAAVLSTLRADNYDELTVAEVSEKLDNLSTEELKKVREFEKRNKNHETLVGRIDRKIRATS